MEKDPSVVVLGVARTPFGSLKGRLSSFTAPQLASLAIQAVLQRSGVHSDQISEVILGEVLTAGVGQSPARQAALLAGLSVSVPTLTINKVCGSGMQAILLGCQSIRSVPNSIVVVGGMESMSQAPYLLPSLRSGMKMGHTTVLDSMLHDSLWDPYHQQPMGQCAERCAREWHFTRQDQDAYALESFKRAQAAEQAGKWKEERIEVKVPKMKGGFEKVTVDEGLEQVQLDRLEKIPHLQPAFDPQGSITAANASSINDGAAVLLLASSEVAKQLQVQPLATLKCFAVHAQAPEWFTTAPIGAIQRLLAQSRWSIEDVDLWEVNEAFAVVPLAVKKELGIPSDRLNVWGGAIALGHPVGASGARIVMTLIAALRDRKQKRGIASICIGGGEALAVGVEIEP